MEPTNDDSKQPEVTPPGPTPDTLQRGQFTRVNTYVDAVTPHSNKYLTPPLFLGFLSYVPEDLSIQLRNVGARIRKSELIIYFACP